MIKFKQKEYSGKGTQAIYKLKRQFTPKAPKIQVMRDTIKTKQVLEKAGHGVADRYAIAAGIAGPVVPIPGVSQALAASYLVAPKAVKAVPGVGKVITKVEGMKTVKALGKPVHKSVDYLFKTGGGPKPKIRKFSLVQKEFGHVKGHGIKSLLVKGSKALDSIGNSEIAVQFRKGLAKSDVERHAIEQATKMSKEASGHTRRLRDSIKKVNVVKNFPQDVKHDVIEKAQQATDLIERFKYVPGSAVAEVPQVILDKGMVATATACLPIPMTTALAPATEKAARKFVPGYTAMSTKAAKKYGASRVKRGLERTVNGIVGIA